MATLMDWEQGQVVVEVLEVLGALEVQVVVVEVKAWL